MEFVSAHIISFRDTNKWFQLLSKLSRLNKTARFLYRIMQGSATGSFKRKTGTSQEKTTFGDSCSYDEQLNLINTIKIGT